MTIPDTIYTMDVLFAAFVVLFGVAGLLRGFAGELARLLTLTALLVCTCFYYPMLTQKAAQQWQELSPVAIQAVTAVALLLSGMFLYAVLRAVFLRALKEHVGVFFDRVLGFFLGGVFGALFGVSILCAVSLLPYEAAYKMLSEKSVMGGVVCERLTPWLYPRLMELPVFDQGPVSRRAVDGDQETDDGSPTAGFGVFEEEDVETEPMFGDVGGED